MSDDVSRTDETQATAGADAPATATARPGGTLANGDVVGRYIVRGQLGAGAMGVVYAAFDPELDRKVALKLLRADKLDGSGSKASARRARLVREAQAQARLSHPNVVGVLDVGTVDDQVFVAMEHIDGVTLREWLRSSPRTWRQVVKVFSAAGRGLAAAHGAGLIHRDFKPDNVLVGRDGRVCVTDFGLARAVDRLGESTEDSTGSYDGSRDTLDPLASPLTRTGALIGTPRYMAPEQHAREQTDRRTDQFSFCVALYEALYGEPPFGGATIKQLELSVRSGDMRPEPKDSRVPRRIRRALVRGLEVHARDRFPSMDALLAEFGRDPAAARKKWIPVAASVAVAGALIGYQIYAYDDGPAACSDPERELAGVWDRAKRAATESAFLSSDRPYAPIAWRAVQTAMDEFAAGWTAMHTDACEDTHVRKEQSQDLLDLRMACLSRRLIEARALTDMYADADADVIAGAVDALQALGNLDACADLAALQSDMPPPDDDIAGDVAAVDARLAEARALLDAGKYAAGLGVAEEAVTAAKDTGYRPVQAEALFEYGDALSLNGNPRAAIIAIEEAVLAAEAGRHDDIAARGLAYLVYLVGAERKDFDAGRKLQARAEAALERVGNPRRLRLELLSYLAFFYRAEGKYDDAVTFFTQVVDMTADLYGDDDPLVARARNNLGGALMHAGKYDEALAEHEKARSLYETTLGAEHPEIATVLTNLGNIAHKKHEYTEAEKLHGEALAIREAALSEGHPKIARSRDSLGLALYRQKKFDDALALYEQALAMRVAAFGELHSDIALSHHHIADVHARRGENAEAIEHYETAISIYEETLGDAHPHLARVLGNLGIVYKNQGRYDDALERYRRTRDILEASLRPGHPNIASVYTNMANVYALQGRHEQATGHAKKALEIYREALGDDDWKVGMAYYNLGVNYNKADQPEEALKYHQLGMQVREAKAGPDDLTVAASLDEIGNSYSKLRRWDRALEALRRGERIRAKKYGDEGWRSGVSAYNIADTLWRQGFPKAALPKYQHAAAQFEAAFGADDSYTATALTGVGLAYLDMRAANKAVPVLERALAIRDADKGTPGEQGVTRFALARALWMTGRDRGRAVELAKRARADVQRSIEIHDEVARHTEVLEQVDAWLERNGGERQAVVVV